MTPRYVHLFGLRAGHRYGQTYEATLGQVTYVAHDEGGRWSAAIHDAASMACWALGHGDTLPEAEAACERMLRREGRMRVETAQEIAERRKVAA